MRRRLRKKKHIGEFKELGFEVLAILRPHVPAEGVSALLDRWIDEVERRHMAFGGGCGEGGKLEGFVSRWGRGSLTEEDRQVVIAFFDGDKDIVRHQVGALQDAWR